MEIIHIKKNDAIKAYRETDSQGKTLLSNLLGEETFAQKITDRVKSIEDACGVLGLSVSEILSRYDTVDEIAYKKLKTIAKALNEDWTPDWSNWNEYKYYPYFEMNKKGIGFVFDGVGGYGTISFAGSRLCFRTRELAEYAGKQFITLYNEFLTIQ